MDECIFFVFSSVLELIEKKKKNLYTNLTWATAHLSLKDWVMIQSLYRDTKAGKLAWGG